MRLHGLGIPVVARLRLKVAGKRTSALPHRLDFVRLARIGRDVVLQYALDGILDVRADDLATRDAIEAELPFQDGVALEIVLVDENAQSIDIDVVQFGQHVTDSDAWRIGLADAIVEEICERELKLVVTNSAEAVERACAWMRRRFLVGIHDQLDQVATGTAQRLACISAGPDGRLDKGFRLVGSEVAADVDVLESGRVVSRLVRQRTNTQKFPVLLVRAPVDFTDATEATVVRERNRAQLAAIQEQEDAYLRTWDAYLTVEKRQVEERAAEFGSVAYGAVRLVGEGRWAFELEGNVADCAQRLQALGDGDVLETSAPQKGAVKASGAPAQSRTGSAGKSRPFVGAVVQLLGRELVLRRDEDDTTTPQPDGELILSTRGDAARISRREQARALIASRNAPMSQLGLLLELQSPLATDVKPEKVSERRLAELFGLTPTEKQREAFFVALRTPDIALIQGPPGTGKTKVIEALAKYLGERDDHRGKPVAGRLFLTSDQHHAVGKIARDTSVFGLPALKLGRKRDEAQEDDPVEPWRLGLLTALEARIASQPALPSGLEEARVQFVSMLGRPVDVAVIRKRTDRILELGRSSIDTTIIARIHKALDDFEHSRRQGADAGLRARARKAAWAIPCLPESFVDGGQIQVQRAHHLLADTGLLAKEDEDLLIRAAATTADPTAETLQALAELRGRLLDRMVAARGSTINSVVLGEDLEALLAEGIKSWEVSEARRGPRAVDVMQRFRSEIDDPEAARQLVRRYTAVLAATCQQSVGTEMTAHHRAATQDERMTFETVIVDEAARVNPLDLQIPLALARRRIVLVGDHRQLPHMLEPDVERELSTSLSRQQLDALEQSLFHRLYEHFRVEQSRPGSAAPHRVVTLNTQFRMHPRLGRLVSEEFYEKHKDTTLQSGGDPAQFAHSLKKYRRNNKSCCAAWLNVPLDIGKEERTADRSIRRPVEAAVVAREAIRVAEEAPTLTIGIIAFYRAQVDEIWECLGREGWAERLPNKNWAVADDRSRLPTGQTRVRVGTVDAFQGLEFDIVFLSVTRANRVPAETERDRRRKFGHVAVENRLCVAMSRQHRLLVAVGDIDMTRTPGADMAVSALVALRRLCEEEPDGRVI